MKVVVDENPTKAQKANLTSIMGKQTPKERLEALAAILERGWTGFPLKGIKGDDENLTMKVIWKCPEGARKLVYSLGWVKRISKATGLLGVVTMESLHNAEESYVDHEGYASTVIICNLLSHIATINPKKPVQVVIDGISDGISTAH